MMAVKFKLNQKKQGGEMQDILRNRMRYGLSYFTNSRIPENMEKSQKIMTDFMLSNCGNIEIKNKFRNAWKGYNFIQQRIRD